MKIKTFDNKTVDLNLPDALTSKGLLALPGLIDPHVHFRTPGGEHKEDWQTGAKAALAGGVTTVLEMPNASPPTITLDNLQAKKKMIKEQLALAKIPLHYYLYFGATVDNLAEIEKAKDEIVGIKLYMGSSTGNLLVDKLADQEKIFELAAKLNLVVAVHAEDEKKMKKEQIKIDEPGVAGHSVIRNNAVAAQAVQTALSLAEKYKTKTYLVHVSTKEELALIRAAKAKGLKVFAEASPHHLFLTSEAYQTLGTKAQMNPPLRSPADQQALWEALLDGTIDTIGSDHAPHTLAEKALPYPKSPSGVPGIETTLPLLLNSYNQGKISLAKIVELTSINLRKIFNLPTNNDWVIVNLDLIKEVKNENLKTKCHWSPFAGWKLKGWPVATIINGATFINSKPIL